MKLARLWRFLVNFSFCEGKNSNKHYLFEYNLKQLLSKYNRWAKYEKESS
ncbi:hypothetical protein [Carboxylicivirga taeanensis]